jgi:hypothetical protein
MPRFYQPDLAVNIDNPFMRDVGSVIVALVNPREGLPIEAICQATNELQRRETHSDDKTFRLTRLPIQDCR